MPSSVAIIASVDPQHTVTCVSGSMASPWRRPASRAMAARSSGAPQVTAYWLMSASMARAAAALIASGAGKSGKPCDRLTAPCRCARRVISRMTDSVKQAALRETRSFVMPERLSGAGAASLRPCRDLVEADVTVVVQQRQVCAVGLEPLQHAREVAAPVQVQVHDDVARAPLAQLENRLGRREPVHPRRQLAELERDVIAVAVDQRVTVPARRRHVAGVPRIVAALVEERQLEDRGPGQRREVAVGAGHGWRVAEAEWRGEQLGAEQQ